MRRRGGRWPGEEEGVWRFVEDDEEDENDWEWEIEVGWRGKMGAEGTMSFFNSFKTKELVERM